MQARVYEQEKYFTNANDLKSTLDEFGVAIIPNVLSEQEINNQRSGVCDYLEHITQNFEVPFDRGDQETWKSMYEILPAHSMLMQHFGIGQSQYVWDIRQNPKVVDIFSKLWETQELLVSFDGASFHLPPEVTGRGWFRNLWLHSDQSYARNDFECVQSWVTAYDVDEGDGTLAILEGSHKHHKRFSQQFGITERKDWYKLSSEEINAYLEYGCPLKYITCPAGSMVFWDSRTIHCGVEPVKGREKANFRNVVYICMTPKELCKLGALKRKITHFRNLRTTNHWPHKPIVFAKTPRTWGKALPNIKSIDPPKLTPLGEKLVGL